MIRQIPICIIAKQNNSNKPLERNAHGEPMDIHDIMVAELFHSKSISALILLINQGRELAFQVGTSECFISKHGAAKAFSLFQGEQEQSFDSMEDLVAHSKIGNQDFMEAWKLAVLDTLF